MTTIVAQRDSYCIDTDPARLQEDVIYSFISQRSYWGQGRPLETMRKAIANSLNFGVYAGADQVGYARLVTDQATFGHLCDVFILETHRGLGLGKWLVETITRSMDALGVRKLTLSTNDAHELYRRYGGFAPLDQPENTLQRIAQPHGLR